MIRERILKAKRRDECTSASRERTAIVRIYCDGISQLQRLQFGALRLTADANALYAP